LARASVIELASEGSLDVIVLHVLDEASLPAFTDQPQHETGAWAREFLQRYCPFGVKDVKLEMRIGQADELVPRVSGGGRRPDGAGLVETARSGPRARRPGGAGARTLARLAHSRPAC
jgi:hypothetical protein